MLSIDVRASRELKATVLALRRATKDVQGNVRKYTRQLIVPEWAKELAQQANTRFEVRTLVDTARAKVSNQTITLTSASLSRPLRGGLKPSQSWWAAEFGADQSTRSAYDSTSRKGRRFKVKGRHTTRQLRPRNREGYVVTPAAKRVIPRVAALWVQTTIRTFLDALEGKQ